MAFSLTEKQLEEYIAFKKAEVEKRPGMIRGTKRMKMPVTPGQKPCKHVMWVDEEVFNTIKNLKGNKSFNQFFLDILEERSKLEATTQQLEKRLLYVEEILKNPR